MKKGKLYKKVKAIMFLLLFLMILCAFSLLYVEQDLPYKTQYVYSTNSAEDTLSVIYSPTNAVVKTVSIGNNPTGIAISPDGTKAYIANWDSNYVTVLSTINDSVITNVPVGNNSEGIAVSTDGTKIYVASADNDSVFVIDADTYNITGEVKVGDNPLGTIVNPAGTRLYVVNYYSNNTSIIDTTTNSVIATVNVGPGPQGIAINPKGTKVYVTNYDGNSISIVDTTTNRVTDNIEVNRPSGIALTPDGTKLYISNIDNKTVSVINANNNTLIATVPVEDNPNGISVTPDGSKVYVTNSGTNRVSVIDTSTNTVIATIPVGWGPTSFGQCISTLSWYDWIFKLFYYFVVTIFIYFFLAIPVEIVMFFYSKLSRKKYFEQIYKDFKNNTPEGKKLDIKDLHFYLQKNTNEELLLYNLKFNGVKYFPSYHKYLIKYSIITVIFIYSFVNLINGLSLDRILVAPILITFLPMLILGIINKCLKIKNLKNFLGRSKRVIKLKSCHINDSEVYVQNVEELNKTLLQRILIFISILILIIRRFIINTLEIISPILLTIIIFFIPLYIISTFDLELIDNLKHTDYIYNVFLSPLIDPLFIYLKEFNLGPEDGTRLSLAGYFFSLAVGGTVVLSVADRYFEEEDTLRKKLSDQITMFEGCEGEIKCLSLNFFDVKSSDSYINLSKPNIKTKINYIISNIKNFNKGIADFNHSLSDLQKKLECVEIKNRSKKMDSYEIFIYLIVLIYLAGIITIFAPDNYTTILFWFFILISSVFTLLLYYIYISFKT